MKVSQLIECLKHMPQNANVMHLWDGEARTSIEFVWLAKSGDVITADGEMVSYSDEDRPSSVPSLLTRWRTPSLEDVRVGVLL